VAGAVNAVIHEVHDAIARLSTKRAGLWTSCGRPTVGGCHGVAARAFALDQPPIANISIFGNVEVAADRISE
jgi:hypothetical protein